jgi:hypothetical protein
MGKRNLKMNLARRYHIPIPPQTRSADQWEHRSNSDVLAIRFDPETKQRTLDALRWGLIPNWAKDPKIAYKRVETVDTAPTREPEIALTGNVRQQAGFRLPNSHPACSPARSGLCRSLLKYSRKKVDFYLNNK